MDNAVLIKYTVGIWNPDFLKVGSQMVRFSNGRALATGCQRVIAHGVIKISGFFNAGTKKDLKPPINTLGGASEL